LKKLLLLLVLIASFYSCKKQRSNQKQVTNPDYDKAEILYEQNNDSAFFYFNKVATSSKDSLRVAMAYNYMAVIQADAGDFFGGQESLITSLKFLNVKDSLHFACLSSDYNELGVTCARINKQELALTYYNLSKKYTKNEAFKLGIENNKALCYQNLGDYNKALHIYDKIIPLTKNDQKEYAKVSSNNAKTKWLQNPKYNAEPEFINALNIRIKEKDKWGQNASYAHLADYYMVKKPDSALLYAQKMFLIANQLDSPDDKLEALQKLITLSPSNSTKQYFKIYQSLSDSLQTARNAAKNQFAIVRYDTEKSKADNLILSKNNAAQKYQIIILIIGILLLIIAGTLWYKKRKQKIDLEAKNSIRDSQLKTSKRVHDVVANGLYRVMTEIENQNEFDKENFLDKIEDLYEKSRDISYEKPEISYPNFQDTISDLLKSFATDETKILIAGNTPELWSNVSENVKYELEHILQELLVNMKKHSGATNVGVRFEEKQHQIYIYYTDNGRGMEEIPVFKNGLRNTGNRIDHIDGQFIFDNEVDRGLKIQISFPIS
jgi:tetratricopeptide (TPR) repeat protein